MVEPLLSLEALAARLGVPLAWLREEVRHGRLPVIMAGKRRLFDFESVRAELIRRSHAAEQQEVT